MPTGKIISKGGRHTWDGADKKDSAGGGSLPK